MERVDLIVTVALGSTLASTIVTCSERVTEDEVLTAARRRGFGDLREIDAIVLETWQRATRVSGDRHRSAR